MYRYKTVLKEAKEEQIIERSRFIAHVKPVESRDEAESFIASIRSQNKGADHNVPAIVIGDKFQIQWASDDGESQGTAGAPMVQMLVKEEITNVAVVVTRFFGGVKLGKGGLVRAYTSSAKFALSSAEICKVIDMSVLALKLDYSFLNRVQNASQNELFEIRDVKFTESVALKIAMKPDNADYVKSLLADITAGTHTILSETEELLKVPDY